MSMPDLSSAARLRQLATVACESAMEPRALSVSRPSLLYGAPLTKSSCAVATSLRNVSRRDLTRSRKLSLYFSSLPPLSSRPAFGKYGQIGEGGI